MSEAKTAFVRSPMEMDAQGEGIKHTYEPSLEYTLLSMR